MLHLASFGSIKAEDATSHPFAWPVRHHSPRRQHLQSVAVELEKPRLFGADPFWIPGHFDLRNPLVSFNAISPGIGDECVQQPSSLLVVRRRLTQISSDNKECPPFPGEDS